MIFIEAPLHCPLSALGIALLYGHNKVGYACSVLCAAESNRCLTDCEADCAQLNYAENKML